jgi:hypothetical protein
MKLTKSKLKQLIKEAFEEELDEPGTGEERYNNRGPGPGGGLPGQGPGEKNWWVSVMSQLIHDADALYKNVPPEGKELLTENFEMTAEAWKKDLGGYETKWKAELGADHPEEEEYDEEEREI